MKTVRAFHDEAARLGQQAMVARDKNEEERAKELALRGYELELKALDLLPDNESSGLTPSVLLLAAASLAYQCAEYKEALRHIERGLSGCPPTVMYHDFLNLFAQIQAQKEQPEIDEC